MTSKVKITVVGSGYVGMSLAVLLAQHNDVTVLDIDASKVKKINNKQSTVADEEIEKYLINKKLSITATVDKHLAYYKANFIIVATPTNYDLHNSCFDTSTVDAVVADALKLNSSALVVIKSTIPVGHTNSLQELHDTDRVIFSPEFLREGRALKDNLNPSRIIVGSNLNQGKVFANILANAADKKNIKILYTRSTEAEIVKLFANAYLAMRVSFFNELDSFALAHNIDTKSIIDGVCSDDRIGHGYNNPSFGYGGYCLPKDTKQLLAEYGDLPQKLIEAIVTSNKSRKDFIAKEILKLKPKTVGFYRLIMKKDSDNFRSSAIQGIIDRVSKKGVDILIFEPQFEEDNFFGLKVTQDILEFKYKSDVIVANRKDESLSDVDSKCFTRDIFGIN